MNKTYMVSAALIAGAAMVVSADGEQDNKTAAAAQVVKIGTTTGTAIAGTGVAVAVLGPPVAMAVATTFGVASTGTAISALSGAAATSATLAWLGGGALAAGGGGMAAGSALIALAGPVGWAIGGAAVVVTGAFMLSRQLETRWCRRAMVAGGAGEDDQQADCG